ncbi:hypothetical protein [Flavivirga rizhaonensis]|uniref:Uncharacterized protein n=1 Tax=Flavivirga rizhaonensis TaxID=2559571 RepID=A0A4S1DSV4_9FLAO|nr:hypothetical protein [Flavivirga rizhaonensis]TGV00452.1 hypothetical protein EM932_19650 [Flavivirga rizhaonensis]
MRKRIFKYGILVLIGGFLLYRFLPIGDYCGGFVALANYVLFGGLLILSFLIITIIDLIKLWKKKQKFDFIPLLIVLSIGILFYFQNGLENEKFWTEKTLSGRIEIESTPKSGLLRLYENGTFGATLYSADYSCTFQGKYELTDNVLNLKRKDLAELTEDVFTTAYIIEKKNKSIKPIDNKFGAIEIIE